jgi:RNA polymerase sigma-70 factor (ECF subfamily)
MSAPALSDGWAIVADIQAGRPGAFERFFHRYAARVRVQLARRCADPGVVEDLVQDTFLRAWVAVARVQPTRESPMAWLSAIATNLLRDHYRNAWTNRVALVDHTDTGTDTETGNVLARLPWSDPDPTDDDTWAETLLQPIVGMLGPIHRELVQRQMAGVTIDQEANRLALSDGAVKALRHRAYDRLRDYLHLRGVHSLTDARDHVWSAS